MAINFLSEADHDYLTRLLLERMDYHTEQHSEVNTDSFRRFCEREKQVMEILAELPREKADCLREYHENSYQRSSRKQKMYYQCGLSDGFKLRMLVDKL
jgi:hypothetical protein